MGNLYKAQPASSNVAMQGVQNAQIPQSAQGTQKDKSRQYMQSVPNFRASDYASATAVRTQLQTKSEEKKYNELLKELSPNYRRKLNFALKSGILLKNQSDDKSSVLDNLYKIMKDERDKGLDNITVLKECLDIIENPYVITQTCEDIPYEYKRSVIGLVTNLSEDKETIAKANYDLDNMHTGTCPTASIEFDLATKNPAEFFRMVEGLTSPKNEVTKTIDTKSLSDKTVDVLWLLEAFKTPVESMDFDKITLKLKPDKNAIIRARIQNNHRDAGRKTSDS